MIYIKSFQKKLRIMTCLEKLKLFDEIIYQLYFMSVSNRKNHKIMRLAIKIKKLEKINIKFQITLLQKNLIKKNILLIN